MKWIAFFIRIRSYYHFFHCNPANLADTGVIGC